MRKSRGFTLMEILIAVSIVAVLSIIGITSYQSINKRSRDAKRKSDLEQVRAALEMYRTDQSFYPNAPGAVSGLSGYLVPTYLPSIPQDPQGTNQYLYFMLGSGPPYYGYCVCAMLERDSGNTCGAAPAQTAPFCNYYVRNP